MMSNTTSSGKGPTTFMWNSVPPSGDMPLHGCCHSLANYKDEQLILFGGGALHIIFNDVYCFDLKTSTWSYKETTNSEIVAPRISHSAVVHEDKMYVYGGQDLYMPTRFADVLVLDLITFTWSLIQQQATPAPDGPGDRRLHTAHIYRNCMYVLMGEPCNISNSFWFLDLTTLEWHPVHSSGWFGKPILPLLGHSAQVEGDYLYVFGGYHADSARRNGSPVYNNSLFSYHFPSNTWREVVPSSGPRPSPRYASAMAVIRGRVFIYGGDVDGEVYFDDFWCIDTNIPSSAASQSSSSSSYTTSLVAAPPAASSRWIDITLSCGRGRPSARSGHASAVAQGCLFVVGGELPGDRDVVYYSNRTYRYPLGYLTRLSLVELSSLWLAKCNPANIWMLDTQIPRHVRQLLVRNLNAQDRESTDDMMPCTRVV
ncbi:kelch domain-containing protein [Trypanosoma equiperdum]|uniref:Kelch domain-containing protein n=2 Tax=Trypanozoon TaxID=39700 RepID=Q4GZD6_TRYB2|nr:hypothetical protein, conserved [Trypanosoma brucei brucei TREU927]CAJ15998.1 hypothetical protein, conserved [Trypanosoma brucei brucei TREU927]SCU71570.1 kelch domain-containing protein [Trypanosoma equiperdum]